MTNIGCSKRRVIVDYGGTEYTDHQIQETQKIINELYPDIVLSRVARPLNGVAALCNIQYSTEEVVFIVGEAFISLIHNSIKGDSYEWD